MSGLLGPDGRPIDSKTYGSRSDFKKVKPPPLGESFGIWGGENIRYANMPGYGVVQFDLEQLGIPDYRAMREHYQVNASLSVLNFMQHQSDWHIECEDKRIADECEQQLSEVWTQLNRSLSTANWAGYSPSVLQWENSATRNKTELKKVKDLIPETARVNWKEVNAWVPPGQNAQPKIHIYDGIKQQGMAWPIPAEASLWYPLLMENGNHYGKNLLKSAFTSWYFSILIHLFANRYFERFGEPIIKGRAPFNNSVLMPTGETLNGMEYLLTVMQQMRNRSVIALPDDKTEMSNGRMEYDFDITYLEGQMRGADWERYLTRLDEEISIGLFTPILLLRTADVGSYNLGVGHMQMYLWMLNAMNSDRAIYIDKYVLSRIADFNFGPNAPRPRIKFRKMGNQNSEIMRTIIQALMGKDKIAVDIRELGEIAGLTLEEVEELTTDPGPEVIVDPEVPWGDEDEVEIADPNASRPSKKKDGPEKVGDPRATTKEITARVARQAERAFRRKEQSDLVPDLGYRRRLEQALYDSGVDSPSTVVGEIYSTVNNWSQEVLNENIFKTPEEFTQGFQRVLDYELEKCGV